VFNTFRCIFTPHTNSGMALWLYYEAS
jgi:hypothetical protein